MILYSALGKEIDEDKFQSSILYVETSSGYKKIKKPQDVRNIIQKSNIKGNNILLVMWEESGGHTINILEIEKKNDQIYIKSKLLPIGDKYPAEAILIISTLITMGYDLLNYLDKDIIGIRTMISADDKKKIKIVNNFAEMNGNYFAIKNNEYKIGSFEQVNGKISIIHLWNEKSNIYFRPSGTGPGVRIYYFGPKKNSESNLEDIKQKLEQMF